MVNNGQYEFVNGEDYPIYDMENKNVWNHQADKILRINPGSVGSVPWDAVPLTTCQPLPPLKTLLSKPSLVSPPRWYPRVNVNKKRWKIHPFFMGKLPISTGPFSMSLSPHPINPHGKSPSNPKIHHDIHCLSLTQRHWTWTAGPATDQCNMETSMCII